MIWDVFTHNTLCCIKDGPLDCSLDETSWANGSYSDMNRRLKGKKINKGGQHTIVVDAKKRYPIAWTPRHKLFKKEGKFTQEGPMEMKRLCEMLLPLVKGSPQDANDKRRQIFDAVPCLGMDNHFSGDHVDKFLGENGFKAIMTRQRG